MTSKIVVNNIEADAGVSTVTFNSNVVRGGSNLHSTGLALGAGSSVGAVTAVTTYYGDGSQLTGIDLGSVTGATGDFSIADKIVHTGDTNTAIRFPATDTISFETSGSEALRINSNGQIGINTTSPDTFIHVGSATTNTHFLKFEADMGASTNRVFNIFGPDIANSSAPFTFQTGNGYLFKCDAEHSFEISSDRIVKINNGYGSLAPIYGVRAWMRYRGDTNVLVGSGNVSSVTDHSTGSFSMNFTTAMSDANYAIVGAVGYNDTSLNIGITHSGTNSVPTTTSMRFSVAVNYSSGLSDERYISIAIVR